MKISLSNDEVTRLDALRAYNILDTLPEQDFDDLTLLAAQICGTPIALVSLIDEDRQWFKSKVGLMSTETSRDIAFCAHAIKQPDIFVVEDTLKDERFAKNPLVTSDPNIRFYAGAPLITPEGQALGTLCVIDRVPRELSVEQEESLRALSRQVMTQLELRRQFARQSQVNKELEKEIAERRRAEEAQQQAEQRYSQIVDEAEEITHKGHALMASTKFRRVLTRAVVVPLVLMVVLAGGLLWQIKHLVDKAQWVDHTDQVIAQAHNVRNLLVDMETGESGYLLTGNLQFLEPYTGAVPEIDPSFERLSKLVSDNPPQVERLAEIQSLSRQWRDFARQLTALREQGGDYQTLVNGGTGRRLMDGMRTKFAAFLTTEESLREERISASQRAKVSLGIGIGLTLLLGVILAFFARRQLVTMSRGYGRALAVTRQQTEALRTQQEFLREVIDTNPNLIFVKDWEGRFTLANSAIADLYGSSTENLIGKSDGDFNNNPEEVRRFLEADREVMREKQPRFIPEEPVTNALTGEVRWLQTIKVPLSSNGHGGVQVLGVATDITERKRAEGALKDSEEQLRQSQKLEAIGQLAGGVAHDFNNLLTVITGYSDLLLRRHGHDDSLRSKITEIRKAGDRAAALTRQLLAFSRKQTLQPKVLEVNALVTDIGKMLRRLIGEDIEVVMTLRPEVDRINADPGQIEQVLMNLVVNARDAMPQGGKLIIETSHVEFDEAFIQTHLTLRPGRYVMMAVSDTGSGMDAETQKHIFDPFFTTKEVGKGTGLGLSTVYGIVKQSGGSIWVYSEVGKGTTFKIYLPRYEDDGEVKTSTTEAKELVRGKEIVLLVEDEPMVRALTRENLEECGYKVLEASNGEEALSICDQHDGTIDLMLTDVVMPLMSGREVAERITKKCPGVKVLYMSGYTDDAIVHHGVLDAGTAFLEKPFTLDGLARKVRSVLDE
jgi:PAS domain S-box-containing protein